MARRGIKLLKTILFGSRAGGGNRTDSDWDFLVVVDKDLDGREKRNIIGDLRLKLIKSKIPSDIIIKSDSKVEEEKNDVGVITYYALKYGVEM